MSEYTETLRAYAAIFEMSRDDISKGWRIEIPPSELSLAAARALRFQAAAIECGIVAVDPDCAPVR